MTAARPSILQIIPRLDTGGAELSAIEITSALVAAGAHAEVLCDGGRMVGRITDAGGMFVPFPAATKNPVRILANARALARHITETGVDLVHARSRAPAWSALLAARWTRRPFVTTYHGAYQEKTAAKRWYNSVMARGDRVIANSVFTRDLIVSRYGTPLHSLRVIHRGIDPEVFHRAAIGADRVAGLRAAWGVGEGQRVILQAARLTGWKGQDVLVEAVAQLAEHGVLGDGVAVLAGDAQGRDGYTAMLEGMIRRRGLQDKVRLVGHVDDMPAAFAAAHVSVVASTEPEAFGRTAAEAQAVECPVIATAIGAPMETVVAAPAEEATGWLVPPADPPRLAVALAEALALPGEDRDAMGRRGRARMMAQFSLAAMKRATLAVYDELLGSRLAEGFDRVTRSSSGHAATS